MQKISNILMSKYFNIFLFLLAVLIIFTGKEIIGTIIFILIISSIFIFCEDVLATLFPFLLVVSFAIRCKNTFDDFIVFWPIVFFIAFSLIFHFVYYRKSIVFEKGEYFNSFLAISIATTLGGLGIITSKEYFTILSICYTFAMGFGMLFIYILLRAIFNTSDKYVFSDRVSSIFCNIIIFLFICVIQYYLSHWSKFIADPDILPFQWRNNASTLLMLFIPFAFYKSAKKPIYIILPFLAYFTIVLTGSRGGLLFGAIEIAICVIYMAVIDAKKRKALLIFCGVIVLSVAVTFPLWKDMITYTIDRLTDPDENKIRLGLWQRAIEDFKANPLFGRGLGYMGNRDIHKSAIASLCWYHCAPLQVIGSFGVLGILCYGYAVFERIRIFKMNKTFFNSIMFLSYISLDLMGLVNPGIFAPLYLFIMTLLFIFTEKCIDDNNNREFETLKIK